METDVFDIEHLASRCGINPLDGFRVAGLSTSNFYRWKQGIAPNTRKLNQWRKAVIDLAIREGALPEGCENKTVPELIELAKGWRV